MLVSNSNISLKMSTFGSRDIVEAQCERDLTQSLYVAWTTTASGSQER